MSILLVQYESDANYYCKLRFARRQVGITERDSHEIEKIGNLFPRLQIDGRKQRWMPTLDL